MAQGRMVSADADPTCHYGAMWRSSYAELARAGEATHTQIADVQRERLDVSHKEEDLDVDTEAANTEPTVHHGATENQHVTCNLKQHFAILILYNTQRNK